MSVRTRVDAPRRAERESARRAGREATRSATITPRRDEKAAPRRVKQAERVKSGAAQRAYERRRNRVEGNGALPPLPGRAASAMAGRIPFVAGIIALLACGLIFTLLLTTRAAEDSYQLGDARRINRQLGDERAALQREVEAADSAPDLANRARELGMIPAKDPSRLLIAPDGTVTVIGKETPEHGAPAPPLNTTPAAPTAVPPRPGQASGERLLPVTSTPAAGANQAVSNQAGGTNQLPPVQLPSGTPNQAARPGANQPVPVNQVPGANPAAGAQVPSGTPDRAAQSGTDQPVPVNQVPGANPAPAGQAPAAAQDQAGVPAPGEVVR
ncbi:hypothetical protein [Nocardia mexicana]|uniref:Cell division protein FtsB n=1 Tax=Nocardia mexicana TaxID=279262 RepID=A0A370H3S4_9NOCA|nr:hypothetical protein [Nocardia mexicana]RDI49862.1 hypothetical protein DFR68_106299 [Nocardia mexicana]